MEPHKISKLLHNSTVSKFVTRKWIEVIDLLNVQYSTNKNIRFKTPMLISELRDYSNVYIAVKRTITVDGTNENNQTDKMITFKNNAPFRSCISTINNTFIDNAKDLDIVMLTYNLLEHSGNYSLTSGSLWNYYKDEMNDNANENNTDNYSIDNSKKVISQLNLLNI